MKLHLNNRTIRRYRTFKTGKIREGRKQNLVISLEAVCFIAFLLILPQLTTELSGKELFSTLLIMTACILPLLASLLAIMFLYAKEEYEKKEFSE